MARKSSLHIKPRDIYKAILHNARVYGLSYAVSSDNTKNETKNYVSKKSLFSLISRIKNDYQKHSYRGRRLPKNSTPIREGVLNLLEHHTLEDVEKVAEKIAEKMGIEILQISIHRDEGKSKNDINFHAHILFNYYNFNTHKIEHQTSKIMEEVQTIVARELGMERGVSKRKTKRKHIPHGEFRAIAAERDNAVAPHIKNVTQLKKEIEKLRKKMIEKNANSNSEIFTKEEYQALNKLKKDVRASNLLEAIDFFYELSASYHDIYAEKKTLKNELQSLKSDLEVSKHQNQEKDAQIANLKQEIGEMEEFMESGGVYIENRDLKSENQDLKAKIEELSNKLDLKSWQYEQLLEKEDQGLEKSNDNYQAPSW